MFQGWADQPDAGGLQPDEADELQRVLAHHDPGRAEAATEEGRQGGQQPAREGEGSTLYRHYRAPGKNPERKNPEIL